MMWILIMGPCRLSRVLTSSTNASNIISNIECITRKCIIFEKELYIHDYKGSWYLQIDEPYLFSEVGKDNAVRCDMKRGDLLLFTNLTPHKSTAPTSGIYLSPSLSLPPSLS